MLRQLSISVSKFGPVNIFRPQLYWHAAMCSTSHALTVNRPVCHLAKKLYFGLYFFAPVGYPDLYRYNDMKLV
jgi:hypothetical protein